MTTNAALTDRIAELLQQTSPQPDDLADAITDAGKELQRLERDRDRARKLSLDPLARHEVVNKAHDDVHAIEFASQRLQVALEQLAERHNEAVRRVKTAEAAAVRAEVTRERDDLVDELRSRYQDLASELAHLLGRIAANNQRAAATGVRPAEAVARDISGQTISGSPIPWLIELVRLPAFDPRAAVLNRNLWPLPVEHKVMLPQSVHEGAARQGAEMRRIGEHAAQHETELLNALRKTG